MLRTQVAAVSLLCLAALGCEANEACERARMDLSKTWTGLREAATKRKLAGVDPEGWAKVEERAALLESSFVTPHITWQSADKARVEIAERVATLSTDTQGNLSGYRLSLEAALRQQDALAKQCR